MRALFGRKVSNLAELHDLTAQAVKRGQKGQPYTIIREVALCYESLYLTLNHSKNHPF